MGTFLIFVAKIRNVPIFARDVPGERHRRRKANASKVAEKAIRGFFNSAIRKWRFSDYEQFQEPAVLENGNASCIIWQAVEKSSFSTAC
ncbi:MAG: hypothetical protein H0W33_01960 [Gammaproteobacteria bacterium]|nr:hypothetical protein [Gammaproteobacteria bacterium]